MFASPSRKLFWVLWVFLVRHPQLHVVDNLIDIIRVFNPATKKGHNIYEIAITTRIMNLSHYLVQIYHFFILVLNQNQISKLK